MPTVIRLSLAPFSLTDRHHPELKPVRSPRHRGLPETSDHSGVL